ncbi:ABC transporter ATP-binding protein [candidate division WOR-3 bacterium]|nr:ABC transporter ATP-binding protein [candidate division WOR-3 bacterium]
MKNSFSRLKNAIAVVFYASKKLFFARIILTVIRSAIPVLLLYIVKLFVDSVATSLSSTNPEQGMLKSIALIAAAGAAYFVSFLADSLNDIVSEYFSLKTSDKVYEIMHKKSSEIDIAYYDNPVYYDTLHRAQRESPYRPVNTLNQFFSIFQNLLTFSGVAVLIFSVNSLVGLILFAAVIPGTFVQLYFVKKIYSWQKRITEKERETWYYNYLLTSESSSKEVKIFSTFQLFRDRFQSIRNTIRRKLISIKIKKSAADFSSQVFSSSILALLMVFMTFKTYRGEISLGNLVMFLQAFQRGQGSLKGLLGGFVGLYENSLFLSYFAEFLGLKTKIITSPPGVESKFENVEKISLRKVVFSYPGSKLKALDDLNLTLEKGRFTAIVGSNGSGKSTIAKILCRLYDPDGGSVFVDSIDLKRIEPMKWYDSVSLVFQDFQKYQLTLAENVSIGDVERLMENESVVESLRDAGAVNILDKLTEGINTKLGKWFKGGEELSFGEWQKLALARCLFKRAPVYIFDEPTSHLDPETERLFLQKVKALSKKAVVALISHKFSNVKHADIIYVLDKGTVVEMDSHENLIKREGFYAELYAKSLQEQAK